MNYLMPFFEDMDLTQYTRQTPYLDGFKAEANQTVLQLNDKNEKVFILGLGKKKDPTSIARVIRLFFYKQKAHLKGEVKIHLYGEMGKYVDAIQQGVYLGQYEIGFLKTDKKKENWYSDGIEVSYDGDYDENLLSVGKSFAETQIKIMRWGDSPANYKTPVVMAQWIRSSGAEFGYEVEVFDRKKCEEVGLKSLLGVARAGEENPPVFCILKYSHPDAKKTVALAGKGVTFDTGGVSLKPGEKMNYMKSDMGGAAAVAGTFEMAAKLKLPINLVGAIPFTENLIGSLAIKPGDVIGSYSGKTIEIINTDAEGRLILADALAYLVKNHPSDILVDLATLTGNAIMALGYKTGAMITPNEDLAKDLFDSGQKTGERLWRLPHWDDYNDAIKSDVADVKNLADWPMAGAVNAAKFLEVFIDKHPAWAHLDIAGAAFGDSPFGSMKSATGYGPRLLIDYLQKIIKS